MRALSLWRPWPWCILHWPNGVAPGPKWIENRTWPPPAGLIGQLLALHAAQRFDDRVEAYVRPFGVELPPSADHPTGLVGTARVAGFVHGRDGVLLDRSPGIDEARAQATVQSPWFFGPFGWVLEEVRPLRVPIPHRGAQGLWTVQPHALGALEAHTREGHP